MSGNGTDAHTEFYYTLQNVQPSWSMTVNDESDCGDDMKEEEGKDLIALFTLSAEH